MLMSDERAGRDSVVGTIRHHGDGVGSGSGVHYLVIGSLLVLSGRVLLKFCKVLQSFAKFCKTFMKVFSRKFW